MAYIVLFVAGKKARHMQVNELLQKIEKKS